MNTSGLEVPSRATRGVFRAGVLQWAYVALGSIVVTLMLIVVGKNLRVPPTCTGAGDDASLYHSPALVIRDADGQSARVGVLAYAHPWGGAGPGEQRECVALAVWEDSTVSINPCEYSDWNELPLSVRCDEARLKSGAQGLYDALAKLTGRERIRSRLHGVTVVAYAREPGSDRVAWMMIDDESARHDPLIQEWIHYFDDLAKRADGKAPIPSAHVEWKGVE